MDTHQLTGDLRLNADGGDGFNIPNGLNLHRHVPLRDHSHRDRRCRQLRFCRLNGLLV